mmetsp:Transcript_53652/g.143781  ORF Transcript_53652/g.143781 Transcript_53652/m.143781 type:complete len:489 (+) Transcript_53652:1293-2759(+)
MHPPVDIEPLQLPTPRGQQWRRDLEGLCRSVAINYDPGILVTALQAVDELLSRLPVGHTVERKLGQHPLVAVAPAQQGNGIWEHFLCAHRDEPLADALILSPHRRRRHCPRISFLPSRLGAVLTPDRVLGSPGQRQHAQGLQLQELAKLQQSTPGGRQVRRVHQDGVAGLQLAAVELEDDVGGDDGGREADLLRGQLLEDLVGDPHHVLLVAREQGARGADRTLCRKLCGLGQYQDGVLGLQVLHASPHLLDAAHAHAAEADTAPLQLRVDHGVVHRHCQHANEDLIVVDSLLQRLWLCLDLYCATKSLAVGICFRRPEDVLHRACVVDLRGKLGRIEEVRLHEVLVCQHHGSLVALAQPLRETLLVCLRTGNDPVLKAHDCSVVLILGPGLEVQSATTKALDKLLLGRLLGPTGGVITPTLLLVGQNVVGLVQQLELLGVAALVGVFSQDFRAEPGTDLMEGRVLLNADQLVVIRLCHGWGERRAGL